MKKHQASVTSQDAEYIFDKIYQRGLELLQRKQNRRNLEKENEEEIQCTFKPQVIGQRRRKVSVSPVPSKQSKTPPNLRQSFIANDTSQRGTVGYRNPDHKKRMKSDFEIRQEIQSIYVKGTENEFLREANEAAMRRQQEFLRRFPEMKTRDKKQLYTDRERVDAGKIAKTVKWMY